MASASSTAVSLFLSLNLLFFALVSSTYDDSSNGNENGNGNKVVYIDDVVKGDYNRAWQQHRCSLLNLDLCVNVLGLLDLSVGLGNVPTQGCGNAFGGLVDLDAAVCLCAAIKLNLLGIEVNVNGNLNNLLNNCGIDTACEYRCARLY
ncbi:hypothetical protein PTKIN_Ptkin16aG0049400 [Pterospermum kingtungense]